MMTVSASSMRQFSPLIIAAPLLAGCAGSAYPPPPGAVIYEPHLVGTPYRLPPPPRLDPRQAVPYRPPVLPPTSRPNELVSLPPPARPKPDPITVTPSPGPLDNSARPPAPPSNPGSGRDPVKKPPVPDVLVDSRPPGSRCPWWALCNLWE